MLLIAVAALSLTAPVLPEGDSGPSLGPQEFLSPPNLSLDVTTGAWSASTTSTVDEDHGSLAEYFSHWEDRVERSKATQPEWIPPLMTLSPLITELLRWDANYQNLGGGDHLLNLGANKGLFLVPTPSTEVDIGLPSYEERYGRSPASGLGDYQFLLIKQRLLSANAGEGDYILTAALAGQAPIGAQAFTSHAYLITPFLLGGKGFENLDIQVATGLSIPSTRERILGKTWATNVTAQYHIAQIFWPEVEVNWTHWLGGTQRPSLNQEFLTLGLLVAPIPITEHLKLAFGIGFQFAVAPGQTYVPVQTPTYRNNFIFTGRVLF